jgi:hypothetical protein
MLCWVAQRVTTRDSSILAGQVGSVSLILLLGAPLGQLSADRQVRPKTGLCVRELPVKAQTSSPAV